MQEKCALSGPIIYAQTSQICILHDLRKET